MQDFSTPLILCRSLNSKLFLPVCIAVFGCYSSPETVPVSLGEFSAGTLMFRLSEVPPILAQLYLRPVNGFVGCPILVGTLVPKLNGKSQLIDFSNGSLWKTEGYMTCKSPTFTFSLESLEGSSGAPDGEFTLSDGNDVMQFTIGNLLAERKLIHLTAPGNLKPGGQVMFGWQPVTDSVLKGEFIVQGRGPYTRSLEVRVESGKLIANLPNDPWPSGAVLHIAGYARAPIVKCEGVQTCESAGIGRGDSIELPTL